MPDPDDHPDAIVSRILSADASCADSPVLTAEQVLAELGIVPDCPRQANGNTV